MKGLRLTAEINAIRGKFELYILRQDLTLQEAADLIGWKHAASVKKFLAGKHRPNARRLYRIKRVLKSRARGNHGN